MKKLFLFFLVLIFPTHAHAQDALKRLETKYNALNAWHANFTQTSHIESLKQNLVKNGKIQGKKTDKLRIDYTSDPKKTYIYNGSDLWVWQHFDNTALHYKNANQILSREALSFLNGLHKISTLFDVVKNLKEPAGFLTIKNKSLKKIVLIPKDEESSLLRLTLGIDEKSLILKEAVIYNSSGNVTHYEFKEIDLNADLSNHIFELPKDKKIKIKKSM